MAAPVLPVTLPSAATVPATVKAALPALTVMLVDGAANFLIAVLILIAGWSLSRWIGRWLHNLLGRAHYIDETLKPLLANFAAYGVLALTVVAVLSQFGVQTTSLIALLGAAGLAIGLALQGTLSNVASGVMLLFLRPFRVYEKIRIADATGTVHEIGLFRTAMTTDDGLFISIPNSTIFSGTIVNLSRESLRRSDFTVDIDHAADIAEVRKTILDALARNPNVLKSPAAAVEVESLTNNMNQFSIQAWVSNRDFGGQRSELRAVVRKALLDAGITPPIPIPAPSVAPWSPPEETAARPGDPKSRPN
jgi:small conductance mechanosensitive channel